MARTVSMSLVRMLVMTRDVEQVIEYLATRASFQLQTKKETKTEERTSVSAEKANPVSDSFNKKDILSHLEKIATFLEIETPEAGELVSKGATSSDAMSAKDLISSIHELSDRYVNKTKEVTRLQKVHDELYSFNTQNECYATLEHLSFLSLRVGSMRKENISRLKESLKDIATVIQFEGDETKIAVATSKKLRAEMDKVLSKWDFHSNEPEKDSIGVPKEIIVALERESSKAQQELSAIESEKLEFKKQNSEKILSLIRAFTVSVETEEIESELEKTGKVSMITGWLARTDVRKCAEDLREITNGVLSFTEYSPLEVPSVISNEEQVPSSLRHGKFVSSFERMIFSYGSPLYDTIDPTPFVAVFFTLLFGIMFGDLGQGLVFFLIGILLEKKVIKFGGWNKFAPIFMAIGISSGIMGLVTGEFFSTESVLRPFALWLTHFFGTPHSPILKVMPSSDPDSIKVIFGIFGVTVALGFIINSIGLLINIINKLSRRKFGSAFFGKTGLSGLVFFWYVVALIIRLSFFSGTPRVIDYVLIGVTLFLSAFSLPFERLFDGERPVIEEGIGSLVISGAVELIEVVSTYLSNSISFVRVGAFALAHAVLGFIINLMAGKTGLLGGSLVMLFGNAIVIVLEGMIVAIQVIRLQYYEFFSKFFNETGSEFRPLRFHYGERA